MAGLEGIDASKMDIVDALGAVKWVYDAEDRFVCELTTKKAIDTWMAADDHDKDELIDLLQPAADSRYEMVPIAHDVWTRRGDPTAVEAQGPPVRGRQATL